MTLADVKKLSDRELDRVIAERLGAVGSQAVTTESVTSVVSGNWG